jgi:uncharacterized membrane protein
MANRTTLLRALGIGFAAGLRSLTAPAAVSWAAATGKLSLGHSSLSWLGSEGVSKTAAKLALGELLADKTPAVPSRLKPASLSFRLISGGMCGAALSLSERDDPRYGAVLGSAGALVGSLLGYLWRSEAAKHFNAPDPVLALLEDAAAVGVALAVVSCPFSAMPQDAWADQDNPAWLP